MTIGKFFSFLGLILGLQSTTKRLACQSTEYLHKERNWLVKNLQKVALDKSVRITLLGGDVHLGAIGQFYSKKTLNIPLPNDYRYMTNVGT